MKPLSDAVKRYEHELDALNKRGAELDRQLADPELYSGDGNERVAELSRLRGSLTQQIEATEQHWMEAMDRLESAQAGASSA